MFSKYGDVQSCIVNHEKRHAFVKMVDRKGAVTAKSGMEQVHDPDILSKARSVSTSMVMSTANLQCIDSLGSRVWSSRVQRLQHGSQYHPDRLFDRRRPQMDGVGRVWRHRR